MALLFVILFLRDRQKSPTGRLEQDALLPLSDDKGDDQESWKNDSVEDVVIN